MNRIQFIIWAGKQGWKHGQAYLNQAWDLFSKSGNIPKPSQILNKAKDLYQRKITKAEDLHAANTEAFSKVTKIPTSYKTPPVQPERFPIYREPTAQEGMIFFRDLGKKMKGHYGPFGQGTDGFRNALLWLGQNSPREIMKVMKQYGYKPKVVPKKPPGKAEGGIMTVSDPGMGDGPFMMEEFLEAVKQGFKGTYDDYIDQIDRSPRDYLAKGGRIGLDEGGVIEEVWDKKGIENAKESLEGMKPHLMEESYIQLLDFLDSKQKELDMDLMESAGGIGEMLGEGGRIGMYSGSFVKWVLQQGPKVWKWMNKPGNNPYDLYKKYLKSVKERSIKGDMKSLAPEMGILTTGGIMANRLASKKLKEGLDLSEEEKKRKWWERGPGAYFPDKAEGGRIGKMYGGDPGFAFSYGGSWADWKDNHASEMPLMDYINQKLPKARNPFSDSSYANGGPVNLNQLIQMYMEEGMSHEEAVQAAEAAQNLPWDTLKKAEGGRIGLGSGTSPKIIENRKRNLYFDLGRDDFMNMFEYLQSSLAQNDYDGRYQKGGKVKKGGIGDLMGELYRLFEIGPLLASPELMDVIQKIPFEKGGKVKKGGGPKMSRRSFLQLMGGLASLPIVGKYFKLAKPLKDITVKIRKSSWNEDVDYGTSGNILFDFVGKSKVGRELIKKYLPKNYKKDWGMDPKDAYKIVKKAKDKGLNIKVTEFADEASTTMKDGVLNPKWYLGGRTLDRQTQQRLYNEAQQRFKKQTSRENIKKHLDDTSFFENDMYRWPKPNYGGTPTRYTDEIIDLIEPVVKKAEGGRIGAAAGRFIDSVGIGPLNINPRMGITETEKPLGPDVDKKIGTTNIGADIMLDLPKDFYLKGEYDKNRASEDIYYQGEKVLEDVPFDHDIWKYGAGIEKEGFRAEVIYNPENERYEFKLVKSFNDGGKVWRPKSAPKLTTTIPPKRGPTPQGLTYLTGDDIVQNIG